MRVLGIDTGSTNIGWAVVEKKPYGKKVLLDYGLWSPKSDNKTINAQIIDKLRWLAPVLTETLEKHDITHIAVELVPNVRMGQRDKVVATENLMRITAIYRKLPYMEIAAVTAKKLYTGNGRASKEDMKATCLKKYPDMDQKMRFDVYDAVAIATVASSAGKGKWWEAPR